MLTKVAVLAVDNVAPFALGVLCEVFGSDRSADGFPSYEFAVCSPDGGPVTTRSGFSIVPGADLGPLDEADLVAVPAHPIDTYLPDEAYAAVRRAAGGGRRYRAPPTLPPGAAAGVDDLGTRPST